MMYQIIGDMAMNYKSSHSAIRKSKIDKQLKKVIYVIRVDVEVKDHSGC